MIKDYVYLSPVCMCSISEHLAARELNVTSLLMIARAAESHMFGSRVAPSSRRPPIIDVSAFQNMHTVRLVYGEYVRSILVRTVPVNFTDQEAGGFDTDRYRRARVGRFKYGRLICYIW